MVLQLGFQRAQRRCNVRAQPGRARASHASDRCYRGGGLGSGRSRRWWPSWWQLLRREGDIDAASELAARAQHVATHGTLEAVPHASAGAVAAAEQAKAKAEREAPGAGAAGGAGVAVPEWAAATQRAVALLVRGGKVARAKATAEAAIATFDELAKLVPNAAVAETSFSSAEVNTAVDNLQKV